MKKIIIILALIFGLTKLTAADPAPNMNFKDFIALITPNTSLFNHRSVMNAPQNGLLPGCLTTPELFQALEKYSPQPASLKYNLSKVALVATASAAAYAACRYYYPDTKGINVGGWFTYGNPATPTVHSACLEGNDPITNLNLTITVQKNGWLQPITLPINGANDGAAYANFLARLQHNLTAEEQVTTGEANDAGDIALLQANQTYTFTISGTVTYQTARMYTLRNEQIITTTAAADLNWIQAFWKKHVATRIASVWPTPLPGELIDDRTAIYHAVITDTRTQSQLHSFSAAGKEKFKEQIIQAVASEIFADTVKEVEIKLHVTTAKDHFAVAPFTIAINAPESNDAIYANLQRPFYPRAFTKAQTDYATELWNISGEQATRTIAAVNVTIQEKFLTGTAFLGTSLCVCGAALLAHWQKDDLLSTLALAGIGTVAASRFHTLYQAHKAAYA